MLAPFEWCVVTSFYQSLQAMSSFMRFSICATYFTLSVNAVGNITFGSFIAEKRKAHKFNLRDTAKHLNIAYGYLCDIEQSRRPAPNGDFVERISAFLNLDKSEHELLLDLAAKSRNTVSADLPDYIMEKDIVRAALRVAKEVDATDEEWQTFMKMLKERKR